ncbi:uncharacterized protein EDB91DRAFT_1152137 [Suillus paluster]|uniref:uncharacterized protein n=1 Tax=Suillus paluster TaxID=48578 RepID=UPI001B867649|nr:uncharacterized protein EDB91DRAFT_1152137 [Suillus paluster]KAG1732199.1 hypothetical protein EDB91DRAFT_1152137 [Suillus paluster]
MSAKNSSKRTAKAKIPERNLRVTDFFAKRPAQAPSSSPAESSQPRSVALATRSRRSNKSKSSSETVSVFNKQSMASTSTPIISVSCTSSSTTASRTYSSACPKTPTGIMVSPPTTSIVPRSSQKRPRSPDKRSSASHLLSATPDRTPHKRKKKFDSDSESELPSAVIYPSTLAPPPTGPHTPSSSKHLIYSSQSDEMELVVPIPDTLHKWRQNTLVSPSSSPCDAGTTDAGPPKPVISPLQTNHGTNSPPETPPQPSASLPSPPDTEGALPLPATPLIASIKAKAFADSPLSDEEKNYSFRELDESSDDDLEDMTLLHDKKGKGKGKSLLLPVLKMNSLFDSPLSSLPSSPPKPSTSYHLRNRSPSASPTCPPVNNRRTSRTQMHTRSGRTSKPAPPLCLPTVVVTKNVSIPAKPKKSINPLEALLREKKAAEKRGNGSAAFQRAEDALHARISSDVDAEVDLNLADENAAWQAIQDHAKRKSSSPVHGSSEDDVFMGERETKILGQEAGEKIKKILISDRDSESKKPMKEKALGVPFWQEGAGDDRMDVDEEYIVNFGDGSNHPVLALLQHLSGIGAADQLALTLSSGVLGALGAEEKSVLVSPLFKLAISPIDALHSLWNAASSTSKSPLRFTDIATALVNLGARRQVSEDLHWTIRKDEHPLHIATEDRVRVVSKLVTLVGIAGRMENFVAEDTPDILLSLVLIGLDRTTICQTIDTSTHTLVSFFSSGSGRTRHIAQWLAYALFLPNSRPSDALPPLDPLILLLSPTPGSGEPFDVTSAEADFEDLGHYFSIVSVALANIEPYVHEENSLTQPLSRQSSMADDSSPRKNQKPLVPLELLLQVLEVTQGRIVDTRAAHLERSRTKAEMHRLQMRVYYQRQALKPPGGWTRTATIQHYFGPK